MQQSKAIKKLAVMSQILLSKNHFTNPFTLTNPWTLCDMSTKDSRISTIAQSLAMGSILGCYSVLAAPLSAVGVFYIVSWVKKFRKINKVSAFPTWVGITRLSKKRLITNISILSFKNSLDKGLKDKLISKDSYFDIQQASEMALTTSDPSKFFNCCINQMVKSLNLNPAFAKRIKFDFDTMQSSETTWKSIQFTLKNIPANTLLGSLLLGCEGNYNFFGLNVKFVKNDEHISYPFYTGRCIPLKIISYCALKCLNSTIFRLVTFGYVHTLAHEIGHVLAYKILTGKSSTIEIRTDNCIGITSYHDRTDRSTKIKDTVISLAGPLSHIVFSVAKIFGAIALTPYCSPIVLGGLIGGSSIWITGELFYAFTSAINRDFGDFGHIRENGPIHLMMSTAALISPCVFAILRLPKLT